MDDLISRQAAIYAIKELCEHYTKTKSVKHPHMDYVIEELELLPSAEPQWILVSERLPENANEVLTTYIVNGNKKRRYVQTSTWYGNEEEGFWSSPWDEYLVPNTKIEVLAWMPLPKPYKAE